MKKNIKIKTKNQSIKIKGKMKIYLQWPFVLTALLAVMNVAMYACSVKAGVLMSIFVVVYGIVAFLLSWFGQKDLFTDLVSFATHYGQIQKKLLREFSIPYAMMDEDGRLIWMNDAFSEVTGKGKDYHKSITTIFSQVTKESFNKAADDAVLEYEADYEERHYRIRLQHIPLESVEADKNFAEIEEFTGHLIAVYLFDETELKQHIKANKEQRFVSGLIYIDNYDDVLENVEEVRQSLLAALIERKINRYISGYGGIVKRLEKDKYFIAIQEKNLAALKEDKFSLLQEVKNVNVGNDMAVTLSISIGLSGKTYAENGEYARIAMELALARGGDQAVIKEGNSISYFGGKNQQQEKNTRVKARVKAQALREFIQNNDKVVVMGHHLPDIDSFGASVGIYRAAKALNKRAYIVVNDLTSSVRPLYDSFCKDVNYEDDMFLTSAQAMEMVDSNTVLVVVDVNKPSYTDCPELLRMTKNIVVLDHHRQGSESITNTVLSYVEPYASSACEMVAEILQYISEGIKLKALEADSMYAGILIDTDNFLTKTGVRTFEAAAFLRRNGADVMRVRKLFRSDLVEYKAKAEVVRNAEIYQGFAFAICHAEGVESPTILGAQAANELLDIIGVRASIVLTSFKGQTYVSARSIDEVNVQVIMERFGGGGHANVAGAQFECSPAEAKIQIQRELDRMIENGELV